MKGHPGKRNPANLRTKQKGEGTHPQARTVLRQDILQHVIDEWNRRNVVAQIDGFECFLARLSDEKFVTIIEKILPRQQNVTVQDDGEALRKLQQKASSDRPSA